MNASTSTTPPRETLQGDRLCTQCLHPLVGRTIEREPQTGLLFVRCGECGTASALFEYPTATPWLNRVKAVIASTLVAIALTFSIAAAGITGGFTAPTLVNAGEAAADTIEGTYRASGHDTDDKQQGRWYAADEAWLATEQGQAAIAASRWGVPTLLPFVLISALGSVVAAPFVLCIGVGLARHRALRRAVIGSLPVALGVGVSVLLTSGAVRMSGRIPTQARTWIEVANDAHFAAFAAILWLWFTLYAATLAILAPAAAALIARLVLPPADRRLVAWLWEWRGKPIPRD